MKQYTVHAAKTHLSQLIAEVEAGEEVVIARGDKPVVKLTLVEQKPQRRFGSMKGKVEIGEAFFEALPGEELALWTGEGD